MVTLHGCIPEWRGGGPREEIICEDCVTSEKVTEYRSSGFISSSLWLTASLEVQIAGYGKPTKYPQHMEAFRAIVAGMDLVKLETKRFEREAWFSGLQAKVRAATGGLSAKLASGLEVLQASSGGRCLFTLQRGDVSVTLITAEDSSERVMGIQGVGSTAPEAIALISEAIEAWRKGELNFQPNNAISFF